jgi:hypothetical protein
MMPAVLGRARAASVDMCKVKVQMFSKLTHNNVILGAERIMRVPGSRRTPTFGTEGYLLQPLANQSMETLPGWRARSHCKQRT